MWAWFSKWFCTLANQLGSPALVEKSDSVHLQWVFFLSHCRKWVYEKVYMYFLIRACKSWKLSCMTLVSDNKFMEVFAAFYVGYNVEGSTNSDGVWLCLLLSVFVIVIWLVAGLNFPVIIVFFRMCVVLLNIFWKLTAGLIFLTTSLISLALWEIGDFDICRI